MPQSEFAVGDRVRLSTQPPYLKTAEPMPMLRPPDLVPVGEEGMITDLKPGGSWVVHFNRGSFLIDGQYLTPTAHQAASSAGNFLAGKPTHTDKTETSNTESS